MSKEFGQIEQKLRKALKIFKDLQNDPNYTESLDLQQGRINGLLFALSYFDDDALN